MDAPESLTGEVRQLLNSQLAELDASAAAGTLSPEKLIEFAVGSLNDLRRALILVAEAVDRQQKRP